MSYRVCFVGGPADGEMRYMKELLPDYKIPGNPPPVALEPSGVMDELSVYTVYSYRLAKVRIEDDWVFFYVLSTMTTLKAFLHILGMFTGAACQQKQIGEAQRDAADAALAKYKSTSLKAIFKIIELSAPHFPLAWCQPSAN